MPNKLLFLLTHLLLHKIWTLNLLIMMRTHNQMIMRFSQKPATLLLMSFRLLIISFSSDPNATPTPLPRPSHSKRDSSEEELFQTVTRKKNKKNKWAKINNSRFPSSLRKNL